MDTLGGNWKLIGLKCWVETDRVDTLGGNQPLLYPISVWMDMENSTPLRKMEMLGGN